VKRNGDPAPPDGEPLIRGEDPGSQEPADARHWVRIYAELISFQEGLLGRAQDLVAAGAGTSGWRAARLAEIARLSERLAFWRTRYLELAGIDYDQGSRILVHGGNQVTLSKREAQLLEHFLAHPGSYFSSRALAGRAWRNPGLADEQVRTYIGRLRRKLESLDLPAELKHQPHAGYAMVSEWPALNPEAAARAG
jgi:hypothetical protein